MNRKLEKSRLGSARINEWREDKNPEDCNVKSKDVMPKDWTGAFGVS